MEQGDSEDPGAGLALGVALASHDVEQRVVALRAIETGGPEVVDEAAQVAGSESASLLARCWAMMGIGRLGGDATSPAVRAALWTCLDDPSATIRRRAIHTIGELDDVDSIEQVRRLVDDETLDPSAWFDADGTVGHAAKTVLAKLRRSLWV